MPVSANPQSKGKRGGDAIDRAGKKSKQDKSELEATVLFDRATTLFGSILELSSSKDEITEFAKHAAGFLPSSEKPPFAKESATQISKSDAALLTAQWIGTFARKTHLEEVPAVKVSRVRCITALTKWIWDHKLRKRAMLEKKWIRPDINSAEKLAEHVCPSGSVSEKPEAPAVPAVALPQDTKKSKAKKVRKSEQTTSKPARRSRSGLSPLSTEGLVPLGTAPLSGGKVSQELYTATPALAQQMLHRVRQGAEKFQKKQPTGPVARPPFAFITDKSPAREAEIDSFQVKNDGIHYEVKGEDIRHQFSPAALRTLYEKDVTYCGPPSGGTLAQTSPIGNINKAVEGLTRAMRAGQQPGSRMQPTAAVAIVSTSQKVDGVDKPRYGNLYLFEGGDPGGKETYTQKFNHSDSKAPLRLKGETFPVVNMEIDTSNNPAAMAAANPIKPGNNGMDTVHAKALISEAVALGQVMLGLEPARIIASDSDTAETLPESAATLARDAVQRFNEAVVSMGLLSSHELLPSP